MIPHMMDAFRQSQAAQVVQVVQFQPRPMIRHAEITRAVAWHRPFDEAEAQATFVAAWDGDDLLFVRLIRVQLGEASMGRKGAVAFGQAVTAWEYAAEKALAEGQP